MGPNLDMSRVGLGRGGRWQVLANQRTYAITLRNIGPFELWREEVTRKSRDAIWSRIERIRSRASNIRDTAAAPAPTAEPSISWLKRCGSKERVIESLCIQRKKPSQFPIPRG